MDVFLLAALLISGLLFAVNGGRNRSTLETPTMDDTLPAATPIQGGAMAPAYRNCDAFLSRSERSLYAALKQIAYQRFEIFAKPRIADVLLPVGVDSEAGREAFEPMAERNFDYVLCDKQSLRPLYAIELDPGEDDEGAEQVRRACLSAGLTLISLRRERDYSAAELRQ